MARLASYIRINSLTIPHSTFCTRLFRKQHTVLSGFPWFHDPEITISEVGASSPCKFQSNPANIGVAALHRRFISTNSNKSSPLFKIVSRDEPSQDKLIYNGPLSSMVRLVKFFSLSTSIISSGLLVALYMSSGGGVMTYIAGGFSSVMILTPIVLHWFTKGYITRLYYDFSTKTYTACTYDFFLTDVKMDFKRSDVSLPTVSSVVSSFAICGKPVLVDPRGFLNPNHYSHLMGYTDTEGNLDVEEAKKAFESASEESKT